MAKYLLDGRQVDGVLANHPRYRVTKPVDVITGHAKPILIESIPD